MFQSRQSSRALLYIAYSRMYETIHAKKKIKLKRTGDHILLTQILYVRVMALYSQICYTVTSINQSPVLKGYLCLVLS
jgi:hypothetical protein